MYLQDLFLCLLLSSSAIAERKDAEDAAVESQSASVKELSQPSMTVQNASPGLYVAPNFYSFNKGEPFYIEKDPLTGAFDFNKKTTQKTGDNAESNTSSGLNDRAEPEGDYFYDDQEFVEDGIDRKDGSIEGPNVYRPNDIFQNPYKISPDLHQFLNLPVHYSSSDKFPLISSSYANTKIQGTGASSTSYSNHKYVPTSSTQSPSYYTMPTTKYTTVKPQYQTTTRTTAAPPTSKSTTTTTTTAEEEYENTDYNEYEEEAGTAVDNQAVPSQYQTAKTETTRFTVTTYRPTTHQFTTTTRPKTSSTQPPTDKPKQQVSIVTSLPVDIYYSSTGTQEPTSFRTTQEATTSSTTTTANLTAFEAANEAEPVPARTTTEPPKYNNKPSYEIPNESYYTGFGEEPFRPIYGSSDSSAKPEGNNQITYNKDEFYNENSNVNDFHRLPPLQNIPYVQRYPIPTLRPQMEPPRPNAPQSYYPDQPVKLIPGQQATITFGSPPKINSLNRLKQENSYESSQSESKIPLEYKPQELPPLQSRPQISPVFEGRPIEKPAPGKPLPAQAFPDKSNFKMPTKVESHFIKVSSDQENPSYSLQTSFSIGVPSNKDQEPRPSQGVGQVLFPDNTPAENKPGESDLNGNLPSPVLRPPSSRVPIQTYQPNRPNYRPPLHIQARPPPPPPLRLPNEDIHPHPPTDTNDYPRPHWESHGGKPFHGPVVNAIPKKEVVLPQSYPGLNRGKPDKIQRPDLPNILPQFRPNAKLGHVDYHQPFPAPSPAERPREPLDTLQPPPLPQPLHLRINRNDDEHEIDREGLLEVASDPLVHRRSGPQLSKVTTLQMMQHGSQRKPSRPDFPPENRQAGDKEKPVFLVYPSAHGMMHKSPPEEVVVIGTRAQRPLPPANLPEKDDLDTFPLDDNKQFPIPTRDRADTPILKTKTPPKPLIKNDFPYAIVKPFGNGIPEERILSSASNKKEYTEYSPTPSTSTEETKDNDSEINLIPYLQDYMPFAMKKPLLKPLTGLKKDTKPNGKPNQVISTTLNASLATTTTTTERIEENKIESHDKSGSEMTVSATIFTQPQQKMPNHKVPVTYTPSEPQPLGFQAPFMASLSAPESQGWSVVTDKNLAPAPMIPEDTEDNESDDSKFDIENFKPQLFGGFKPIMPSSEENSGSSANSEKDKDILHNKGDREE